MSISYNGPKTPSEFREHVIAELSKRLPTNTSKEFIANLKTDGPGAQLLDAVTYMLYDQYRTIENMKLDTTWEHPDDK